MAIGEIADSLKLTPDVLPLKYEGVKMELSLRFRNLKKEWRW